MDLQPDDQLTQTANVFTLGPDSISGVTKNPVRAAGRTLRLLSG